MCFSAGASFVAGTVLGAAGVVSIKKAKGTNFVFLASIPLLFSFQQFTEGFVWLSLTNSAFAAGYKAYIHIFLAFAIVVWPFFLPFSIYRIEENKKRKKILFAILLFGSGLSLFMLYCLVFRNITASVKFLHIYYNIDYTIELPMFKNLAYIIPTVIPPFISTIKRMKIFGVAIVLSFAVTSFLFKENVVSVWCFFAAIVSVVILVILRDKVYSNEEVKIKS